MTSNPPPGTAVRLRLTKRGQLVLRVTIGVVVLALFVLIADIGGAFNGSTGKAKSSPGALVTSPSGAAPKSTTGSATPAVSTTTTGATTTTTAAVPPAPVHTVSAVTEPWKMLTPLSRMVVLPAGSGLELLGGLLDGGHSSTLVRRLALPSGKITADGSLAAGVHSAAGVVHDGKLYLYGGGATQQVAGIQRVVRGKTATAVGALTMPRADLAAVTVGSKVVLLGGFDGTKALEDVLVSSDGVHFLVLTQLPVPVRYAAPVVRGGLIYLFGGDDVDDKPTDVIQRVDVAAGTATVVGHLPEALGHEAALVFGTTIWLAGGTNAAGPSAKLFRSDDGLAFTQAGSLPGPRSDAGVAMLNGVGYLVGGEAAARLNTVVMVKPG